MAEYKMLPHNIESEQAVLGCILLDNIAQVDIFPSLTREDFYSDAHKDIYDSMLKIYTRSVPVDFITLTAQLETDKNLEKVGGIDYITFLTRAVPSAANFEYYLNIVKSNSIRRKLIKSGQDIIENCFNTEDQEANIMYAEKAVFDVAEKEQRSGLEHVGKPNGAVKAVYDKFDRIAKDPTCILGLSTGFKDFDAKTNGLQNSDLILLAARPGVGKTSFAMNIITHIATVLKKKCAVFSLEMSSEQLIQRAMCSLAKVSMSKALKGNMSPDEWQRILVARKKLEESGLYVDSTPGITPTDLISKCRRLKAKDGLDVIMVDYIQLMSSGIKEYAGNRVNEVGYLSRMLKLCAKELNVPIICLSQLSRAVDQRQDHHPILSDLRESGTIEQDADIVLFLYNPAQYNDVPQEDEPGTVELIIAKHRNGENGTIKLRWIGQYTTFANIDEKVNISKAENLSPEKIEETPLSNVSDANVFDDDE